MTWTCPKCGWTKKADSHYWIARDVGWHVEDCLLQNESRGAVTCCGDRYGLADELGRHVMNDPHDWPAVLTVAKMKEM